MAGALVSPKGITKSNAPLLVRLLTCHTGRLWLVSFHKWTSSSYKDALNYCLQVDEFIL